MIRIPFPRKDLEAAIRQEKESWFQRASDLRKKSVDAGHVDSGDGIWSEIKDVFIRAQEFKCAYCEFPMPKVSSESGDRVRVDHDVEHFRPKNRVKEWPTEEVLKRRPTVADYRPDVRSGAPKGYVRLAFDPLNYVISCKVCNSSYKADRFPIAGTPNYSATRKSTLDCNEEPLLLLPVGDDGDDPAEYLDFDGPMIRPRPGAAEKHRLRARVVIDFFELDTREDLLEGRCLLIQLLWTQLEKLDSADLEKRAKAQRFVDTVEKGHRHLHTACGRRFIQLYRANPKKAEKWYDRALEYLISKDPGIFS